MVKVETKALDDEGEVIESEVHEFVQCKGIRKTGSRCTRPARILGYCAICYGKHGIKFSLDQMQEAFRKVRGE